MINLFIDTNIFLNFYHFSNEDLENLKVLSTLIEANKVKIYLPEQVIHEFERNREAKIQDAVKRLSSDQIKVEIPQICLGYDEAKDLKKAEKLFREKKQLLLAKLSDDIKSNSLKADEVISGLFDQVEILPTNDELYTLANKRYSLGDPPGKKGSVGDAINWETLLQHVPNLEDLYFVSGDSDYISELNENEFLQFLMNEWRKKKNSELYFFKSFNQFLKANFPDVKITTEDIKEAKIEAFENSPNFDAARARLNELYKINEFSSGQINRIVKASLSNNQIYWAHDFSPELVGEILAKIVYEHENELPYEIYQAFCRKFGIEPKLREEDLEF